MSSLHGDGGNSMIAHSFFQHLKSHFLISLCLLYSSGEMQYPVIDVFSKNLRMEGGG